MRSRHIEPRGDKPSSRLRHLGDSAMSVTDARRTNATSLGRILVGDLDWVVMRALEKERARRYQSVSDFIADVQRFLSSDPVQARPPSLHYRVGKFVRRNRAGVMAVGLVVVALIAGIVSTSWGLRQAIAARGAERVAREQEFQQRLLADERREQAERSEQTAILERERSEKEKRVAESVRDFLRNSFLRQASVYEQANLLSSAASGKDAKYDITVRELLDRAAEKFSPDTIENHFPDEPTVQFEILATISDSYLACGEHDAAILFSKAARDVRERHNGPTAPETIASMVDLVFVYVTASRHADAIGETQAVIERLENLLKIDSESSGQTIGASPDPPQATEAGAAAIDAAIEAMVRRVDPLRFSYPSVSFQVYDGAIAVFRLGQSVPRLIRLAEITERIYGAENRRTLFAKMLVGFAYHVLGQQQQAVAFYEDVLMLANKGGQLDELILCGVQLMLSIAYDDLEIKPAESLLLTEQFYEVMLRRAGPDHPITLISMANLAESYDSNNDKERALMMYEKVLASQRERLGADHPDTLNTLANVASCYSDKADFEKAIHLYEESVSLRTNKLGADHPDTIDALDSLASAFVDTGDLARALPLFEKTLELERAKFGSDHLSTLITMQNMAQALEKSGDLVRAIPLYKESADGHRAKRGAEHVESLTALGNLGTALMAVDRFDEAVPCLEPLMAHIKAYPKLSGFRNQLRKCYFKTHRTLDFDRMVEEDLTGARATSAPDSPELAGALAALGTELLSIGASAAAEPVIAECHAIRTKHTPEDWKRFNSESMLGEAFMAQQKYTVAEPLLLSGSEGLMRTKDSIPPEIRSIRLTESFDRLIQIYNALNKPDSVKIWMDHRAVLQDASGSANDAPTDAPRVDRQ